MTEYEYFFHPLSMMTLFIVVFAADSFHRLSV